MIHNTLIILVNKLYTFLSTYLFSFITKFNRHHQRCLQCGFHNMLILIFNC